jgi:hypothetical protein
MHYWARSAQPGVQILVEEMLVRLSEEGWGFAVACSVVGFIGWAFLNLPTMIGINSTPQELEWACQEAIMSNVRIITSFGVTGQGMADRDTGADQILG